MLGPDWATARCSSSQRHAGHSVHQLNPTLALLGDVNEAYLLMAVHIEIRLSSSEVVAAFLMRMLCAGY